MKLNTFYTHLLEHYYYIGYWWAVLLQVGEVGKLNLAHASDSGLLII